ncbi:hypothetical protein N9D31_04305 [Oligoflexaceae bacterium]|nr:hypothetical protein [Oligoflexaceae bacterium]
MKSMMVIIMLTVFVGVLIFVQTSGKESDNITMPELQADQVSILPVSELTFSEPGMTPKPPTATEFAQNFNKGLKLSKRFIESFDDEAKSSIEYMSDWDVRGLDLKQFFIHTYEDVSAKKTDLTPKFIRYEDIMTYPRYLILWKFKNYYRAITLNQNNDNTTVGWHFGVGKPKSKWLDKNTYFFENFQLFLDSLSEEISFRETVYPHIHRYQVLEKQ